MVSRQCRKSIWQNTTYFHEKTLEKLGTERIYLNIIKAIYRVGQKSFYTCEYEKRRVYSCIVIYQLLYCFPPVQRKPTFGPPCITRSQLSPLTVVKHKTLPSKIRIKCWMPHFALPTTREIKQDKKLRSTQVGKQEAKLSQCSEDITYREPQRSHTITPTSFLLQVTVLNAPASHNASCGDQDVRWC